MFVSVRSVGNAHLIFILIQAAFLFPIGMQIETDRELADISLSRDRLVRDWYFSLS